MDQLLGAAPRQPRSVIVRRWRVTAAEFGTGSMLVGPHGHGAQALVPPGVLVRSIDELSEEYDEREWRLIEWKSHSTDPRGIDARRPSRIERVDSACAILFVTTVAPENLEWLKTQMMLRALALEALVEPADETLSTHSHEEFDDLLLDCSQAFGERWVIRNLARRAIDIYALADGARMY
jgi:hypothetical protein